MSESDLSQAIEQTAQRPASATVDGQAVTAQKIADQILADKYLASKAAVKQPHRGLRFSKAVAPGA